MRRDAAHHAGGIVIPAWFDVFAVELHAFVHQSQVRAKSEWGLSPGLGFTGQGLGLRLRSGFRVGVY